ncbi:MAG: hypothetical protein AB1Z98_20145 [Nannocystaceae bacterium]
MNKASNDGWQVIADAGEATAGLPSVLRRNGDTLVLWRDPTGSVQAERRACTHGAAADDDADPCLECMDAELATTVAVREANGWIWAWRGEGTPPPGPLAYFDMDWPSERYTTSKLVADVDSSDVQRAGASPLQLSNLRLESFEPRRHRVTAIVPTDEGKVVVYLRTHRADRSMQRVREVLGGLFGQRPVDRGPHGRESLPHAQRATTG